MLVYKYKTQPPFQCTIKLSSDESKLLDHIGKVAMKFNGHFYAEKGSELTYEFPTEQDMFSFGRFVFETDFDPATYQPNWIVKSINLPDMEFSEKSLAFEELENRIGQHPDTKIQAPSFYNPRIA